ncbi:retrotransposon protein, putative, ty1-copia subclass [Tanacetum coccineum]
MDNVTTAERKDIGKGTILCIYTIELFAFPKNSWVYDTGCGTHICNTKQELRGAKKLKRGSLYLYVEVLVARILNMVPTKKVDKTPYELWHGKVPNLSYLKVWGCEAHVKRHTPDKLHKDLVNLYADFLEKDFILQKESGRNVESNDEDILPSENTSKHPIEEESLAPIVSQEEDVVPVRRSVRTHKAPDRLCLNVEIDPDRLSFNIEVEEHSLGDLNEPANYKAALSDPEFEKWLVAMNEEMQSMNDNKVWKLVVLPPNAKVVKSKWIYKKKTDMDGKVYIYKARLVAKGFTQTYGVDYEETFSPVADIRAIRILIAIAAYYDYEIWQMDVKTAFLNGFLEEEIYMEQPEGFIDPNHPSKVCKLQRSIYGLKQASRSWNKHANNQALAYWNALFDRHNEVACLMIGTMSPKLYQQFEKKSPQEMITELQKMYGKPPGVEIQELVNMFHSCKQAKGQSVSNHVLLMKSYMDQLATLDYAFPDKVSISFILNSLSSEFQAFVQNYNMQSMEKTISEVHSLLIEFEKSIKRNKQQIVGASSTHGWRF